MATHSTFGFVKWAFAFLVVCAFGIHQIASTRTVRDWQDGAAARYANAHQQLVAVCEQVGCELPKP
jgi:hypothetical protein